MGDKTWPDKSNLNEDAQQSRNVGILSTFSKNFVFKLHQVHLTLNENLNYTSDVMIVKYSVFFTFLLLYYTVRPKKKLGLVEFENSHIKKELKCKHKV